MAGLEQYIQPDQTASNTDTWHFLSEAIPSSVNKACTDLSTDGTAFGKLAGSAVIGFALSRACRGGGIYGTIGRGIGAAMTTMSIGELMHTERLQSLSNAVNEGDAGVFSTQFGSLLADTALTTAGGILGARLGHVGARFQTGMPEWPQTVSGQISHRFEEGITYNSTARGAVLKLPTGEHYVWHEHRPFFQTNYDTGVTHFGDGSKLTIQPGRQVTFESTGLSHQDFQMKYRADLQNDFHVVDLRNRYENTWQRTYSLGHGTILFQDQEGYLVTHSTGHTQNFVNPKGSIGRPGKFEVSDDGSRKLILPDKTEVSIAPNGNVQTKGVQRSYLHVGN